MCVTSQRFLQEKLQEAMLRLVTIQPLAAVTVWMCYYSSFPHFQSYYASIVESFVQSRKVTFRREICPQKNTKAAVCSLDRLTFINSSARPKSWIFQKKNEPYLSYL